jgi:type II secretory pathway predicted ATPase ExeA
MATYLRFHELDSSPFEGPSNGRFVLATEALRRAYAEIRSGLDEGSPRVCLSGGTGIGKSSLAAALPKLLESGFRSVLIRDPSMPWDRLKSALVRQLGLTGGLLSRSTLEQAAVDGRRLVLIFDQAEKIEAESLEHLDVILGYKSQSGEQLVQCVLLANLESAPRGQHVALLWWLDQLTTLQLRFSPIPAEGIRAYVDKHLKKAGWRGESLFTDDAIVAIHQYTGGIPGTVGALCEELLARAAQRRITRIDARLVRAQFEPESLVEETSDPHDPGGGETNAAAREEAHPAAEEEAPAWPQLGPPPAERAPVAPRRQSPQSIFDAPEPDMKIEQGFVPMDEPTRSEPQETAFHQRSTEPAWGAPPQVRRRSSHPGRSGTGKRWALITAASLALMAGYLAWPEDAPLKRPTLGAMIPPPEPEPSALDLLASEEDDIGLTDDLRVRETNASKPRSELESARRAEPRSKPRQPSPTLAAADTPILLPTGSPKPAPTATPVTTPTATTLPAVAPARSVAPPPVRRVVEQVEQTERTSTALSAPAARETRRQPEPTPVLRPAANVATKSEPRDTPAAPPAAPAPEPVVAPPSAPAAEAPTSAPDVAPLAVPEVRTFE